MKRFERVERPRANDGSADEPRDREPAPAGRFAAITRPEADGAEPPVQLQLHDRYTEIADEAARERQQRAAQALARKQAEIEERARPHHVPGILDVLAHGVGVGPLAKVGPEARLWLVGGGLFAIWIGVAMAAGTVASIAALAVAFGVLVALAAARR